MDDIAMGTITILWMSSAFFAALWWHERKETRYWKREKDRYMKMWDEFFRIDTEYNFDSEDDEGEDDEDGANWWRTGSRPYGDSL